MKSAILFAAAAVAVGPVCAADVPRLEDPPAVEVRDDGLRLIKDLSHRYRGSFETKVTWDDLDTQNCRQSFGGVESDIPGGEFLLPLVRPGFGTQGSITFGVSDKSGTRHMRYAFKEQIDVSTVMLVHGASRPSALKADAEYPGALEDESQWIAAKRVLPDGRGSDEVAPGEISFWTFPRGTKTRALRISEMLDETSSLSWQGGRRATLAGVYIFPERVEDICGGATLRGTSGQLELPKLQLRAENTWSRWYGVQSQPVTPEAPQEIVASWPTPVAFQGIALNHPGFTDVEVYVCTAPASVAPADAKDRDWKLVRRVHGLRTMYIAALSAAIVDLGDTYVTRGLRLKITAPLVTAFPPKDGEAIENGEHPHMADSSEGGKKVFLSSLMVLAKSEDVKVKAAKLAARKAAAAARAEEVKGLIPVEFEMPYDGFATLVVEDEKGSRVRNLVSDAPFKKGKNTVYWDATDDLGRDSDAAEHGLYRVPETPVKPGTYTVRGITHERIKPVYQFSVYSCGTPPWCTADHKGAWLANHSQPVTACLLPARGKRDHAVVALGANITEGPDGLIFVNPETGVKEGGIPWIGGAWTAANCLAVDMAEGRCARHDYYVGSICGGDKCWEFRLTAMREDGQEERLSRVNLELVQEIMGKPFITGGLAAHSGTVVVSLTPFDKMLVYEMPAEPVPEASLKPVRELAVKTPGGVAFAADGTLFAVTDGKVAKVDVATGALTPVVTSGLVDPAGLAIAKDGTLYVGDQGSSQQVKTFSSSGKLLRAIGTEGPCRSGVYDERHMNHPAGLALDDAGRLWVTENDYLPKRTSLWDAKSGEFVRAFYGPAKYGAGGTFDTRDEGLFYYDDGGGTMEFAVDWEKGESRLRRVLMRPDSDASVKTATPAAKAAPPQRTLYMRCAKPRKGDETVVDASGKCWRKLLTNSFNSEPTGGASTVMIYGIRDDRLVPVAAAGHSSMTEGEQNFSPSLTNAVYAAKWEALRQAGHECRRGQVYPPAVYVWSDRNEDGVSQPDEVELMPGDAWGFVVQDDGAITISAVMDYPYRDSDETNNPAVILRPSRVTEAGTPIYEVSKADRIYSGSRLSPSSGGNQVIVDGEGNAFSLAGVCPFPNYSISGGRGGKATWSYPNMWPGLHAGHSAPIPDAPGRVTAATRLLGDFVRPAGAESKPVCAVNGNHGDFYLFTSDGLFVATVFEDARKGRRWDMPDARRGMDLTGISPSDEHFWPTINQTKRGIFAVVGKDAASVVKLEGVESIRSVAPRKVKVTAKALADIQSRREANESARRRREGTGTLKLMLSSEAPAVDGSLAEWDESSFVTIERRGVGAYFNSDSKPYNISGALRATKTDLYAAWRTDGVRALAANSGANPEALFKTGGGLDIMLSTGDPAHGDVRILAAMVEGKPKVMLYEPKAAGAKEESRVKFSSPVSTIWFDRVIDISDSVELAAGKDAKGGEANYELRVPLSVIGLKLARGRTFKGDIGVLRGQGGATVARLYWSNKATAIVSDVPSEAALAPQNWGVVEVR